MSNDMSMMTSMAISKATQGNIGVQQGKVTSLAGSQDKEAKKAELREAAEGFEAIFMQKMWEEMRASMPENSMHGSKEEEYWQSMYSQQLGKDMAANGGIGLADMMMEQLAQDRVASPSAQKLSDRMSMEVKPAPLLENTAAPKIESKENSPVAVAAQAPSALESKQNDVDSLYESMENGKVATAAVTQGASPVDSGAVNSASVLASGDSATSEVEAPYHAESYEKANASVVVTDKVAAENAPKASPVLSQTIDELNALVNSGKTAEPTIVRTTYISNLPASERKNAILDRNGKISSEHMATITAADTANAEKANTATGVLGNRERTLQSKPAQVSGQVSGQASGQVNGQVNGQGMSEYPEGLMSTKADEKAKPVVAETPKADADVLAGIQSRYVSKNEGQPTKKDLATEEMMAYFAKHAPKFPTYNDVNAELTGLLERGSSREMNTLVASNPVGSVPAPQSAHPVTNLVNLDVPAVAVASNSNQMIQNRDNTMPVFSSMPSLDEALRSGALIASLSPEEIRAAQSRSTSRVNTNVAPLVNSNMSKLLQDADAKMNNAPNASNASVASVANVASATNSAANAIGGPQISQPAHALPNNKVSGISPLLEIQAPLANGELRSGFGWRLDPFSKERAWHTGIDIQASAGSNVNVVREGVVSFAGKDVELGNMVIVDHGDGMQSLYGHNAELLVKEGEKISAGTNIAKVGMSGRAAGAHLHFEVRHNGLSINPEPYLSKTNA